MALYSLLLGNSASSAPKGRRRSSKDRLVLNIADTVVIDPQTQTVIAHFFNAHNGAVLKKKRVNLSLDNVLDSFLKGLVCTIMLACRRRPTASTV